MTGLVGRKVIIRRNDIVLASARTKNVAIDDAAIDITVDDDDAYRRLLEDSAQKGIDITVDGLVKGEQYFEELLGSSALIQSCEIEFPDIGTIAGDFRLNNVTFGAPYNEATTFSTTLQSTGAFTFTPVSA